MMNEAVLLFFALVFYVYALLFLEEQIVMNLFCFFDLKWR